MSSITKKKIIDFHTTNIVAVCIIMRRSIKVRKKPDYLIDMVKYSFPNHCLMLFFYCCRCYHTAYSIFSCAIIYSFLVVLCIAHMYTRQNSINQLQLIRAYYENILNIFIVRLSVVQMNALHRTVHIFDNNASASGFGFVFCI